MNRMSKVAIIALALGTTAAPAMAEAQSRNDHREYRQERRDDRREYRQDRRDDRREHRQDRRDDRRDYRQDSRADRRDPPRDHRYAPPRARNDRWERGNPNWWRGRPEFRSYQGRRSGQWYAPGYGYYNVAPRYHNQRWARGGYLPAPYRSYYVNDYSYYGLRAPPPGHRYVYANGDIVMIAVATGLIASILNNVY